MSWYTEGKTAPELQVADKPITVYKIVKRSKDVNMFRSFFNDYVYEVDVLQPKLNLKLECYKNRWGCTTWHVNKGYHSYSYYGRAIGLWTYRNRENPISNPYVVVECELPIGTKYYIDSCNGEVVSDKIIIKKII